MSINIWDFGYVLAGFVAGCVNTLSGGGSVFVVALLIFLHVPANIANGTNRVGLLVQNITGALTFYRGGFLDVRSAVAYTIPMILGAMLGAWFAIVIPHDTLELLIAVSMLVLLYHIVKKPAAYPQKHTILQKKNKKYIEHLTFFLVGIYGGFAPIGIAIVLGVVLTKFFSFSLIRANAIRMFVIACYTLPVLLIFIIDNQVDWYLAALLGIGQILGTWFSTRYLIGRAQAGEWVKWLLVVIILVSVGKTFGVWEWLFSVIKPYIL